MNQIDHKKYLMLLWLLTPQDNGSGEERTLWSYEKFRKFRCACGNVAIIPERSIIRTAEDELTIDLGDSLRCKKCEGINYEVMSFANRYGLLKTPEAATLRQTKKKNVEPKLDFDMAGHFTVKRS